MNKDSRRRDATSIQSALKSAAGPLMRQMRKYAALNAFLELLPAELAGNVAPYDLHLAQPADAAVDSAGVMTLYVMVSSTTVELVLLQRKGELIAALNARLPYAMVEDLRFEQAGTQKIIRQLNILSTSPD